MTDKLITLTLPEELLNQANSAQIDMRQIVIEALNQEIKRLQQAPPIANYRKQPPPLSSTEAIEKNIAESLALVASGTSDLRKLGLNTGSMWMSDDFDDELPDEFWFGDSDLP